MKPTTAIKRIVAMIEDADENDEEALWAAVVALAGAACDGMSPQGVPYPYPVPYYPLPPTPITPTWTEDNTRPYKPHERDWHTVVS
jgi:hypothetical protein